MSATRQMRVFRQPPDMVGPVNTRTAFLSPRIKGVVYFYATLCLGRDGIGSSTVDPADIRGLATAFHCFVVELPQSSDGSWAKRPIP
jgi:hypothetical protein